MKRIVGDQTAPDQTPQGVDRLAGITAAGRLVQWIEETGSRRFEHSEKFLFALGQRLDQVAAAAPASGSLSARKRAMRPSRSPIGSTPAQVTSPAAIESVEAGGIVPRNARGKNRSLEQRCGQRCALQAFDGIKQRVEMRMQKRGVARATPANA